MKLKHALVATALLLPTAALVVPAAAAEPNKGLTTSTQSNETNATQTPKDKAAPNEGMTSGQATAPAPKKKSKMKN
jgi:hypothetical protein